MSNKYYTKGGKVRARVEIRGGGGCKVAIKGGEVFYGIICHLQDKWPLFGVACWMCNLQVRIRHIALDGAEVRGISTKWVYGEYAPSTILNSSF